MRTIPTSRPGGLTRKLSLFAGVLYALYAFSTTASPFDDGNAAIVAVAAEPASPPSPTASAADQPAGAEVRSDCLCD